MGSISRMSKTVIWTLAALSLLYFLPTKSFAYENEIQQLSSTIGDSVSKSGKKTVAVVDFTDLQGNVTELGRFISEELSVDLTTAAKNFEVIDRTHLNSILTEHKLSISGLVNPKNVKKLGQISGVDAIVTGSVTPFGDSIRVTAKVIATDTARVIGAAKGDIAKTRAIEDLLGKGIGVRPGTTVPSNNTSSSPMASQTGVQRQEADNYIVQFNGCSLSNNKVTCNLTITNKREDRNFILHADSRIFDEEGNEYRAKSCQLGNKFETYSVTSYLVSGVPVKASLVFSVSAMMRQISLLEIIGVNERSDRILFKFRGTPDTSYGATRAPSNNGGGGI